MYQKIEEIKDFIKLSKEELKQYIYINAIYLWNYYQKDHFDDWIEKKRYDEKKALFNKKEVIVLIQPLID